MLGSAFARTNEPGVLGSLAATLFFFVFERSFPREGGETRGEREPAHAAAQRAAADGAVELAPDGDGREAHGLRQEPAREQKRALRADARPHRELIAARQQATARGRPGRNRVGRFRVFFVVGEDGTLGRVSFPQERELTLRHGPERVVFLVVLVLDAARERERAERVVEGLLGAPRPLFHRRVAARRRRRVQVERNDVGDAPSIRAAIGRVRLETDGLVKHGLEDEPLFFVGSRGGCRVALLATPRRANLRVEKTLQPPPRQHLGVAVPDLRPAPRVRVYVRRAQELSPRAERHHAEPRGVAPRVASHHRREHRLSPLGRARRVEVGEMREHRVVRAHRRRRDVVGERARRRAASGVLGVAPARVRGPVGRHAPRTPRGVSTRTFRDAFSAATPLPPPGTRHDEFALITVFTARRARRRPRTNLHARRSWTTPRRRRSARRSRPRWPRCRLSRSDRR